jgi:hypothetical protein
MKYFDSYVVYEASYNSLTDHFVRLINTDRFVRLINTAELSDLEQAYQLVAVKMSKSYDWSDKNWYGLRKLYLAIFEATDELVLDLLLKIEKFIYHNYDVDYIKMIVYIQDAIKYYKSKNMPARNHIGAWQGLKIVRPNYIKTIEDTAKFDVL